MKKVLSVIAFCISVSTVFGFKTKGGEDVIIGYTTCEDAGISVGAVTINALVWVDLIIIGGDVIINDFVFGN